MQFCKNCRRSGPLLSSGLPLHGQYLLLLVLVVVHVGRVRELAVAGHVNRGPGHAVRWVVHVRRRFRLLRNPVNRGPVSCSVECYVTWHTHINKPIKILVKLVNFGRWTMEVL